MALACRCTCTVFSDKNVPHKKILVYLQEAALHSIGTHSDASGSYEGFVRFLLKFSSLELKEHRKGAKYHYVSMQVLLYGNAGTKPFYMQTKVNKRSLEPLSSTNTRN